MSLLRFNAHGSLPPLILTRNTLAKDTHLRDVAQGDAQHRLPWFGGEHRDLEAQEVSGGGQFTLRQWELLPYVSGECVEMC